MIKYQYINSFPKPFLEDLVAGKTLPIIGAGFSKNADIPKNKSMLGWDELGKEFANDIEDYKYFNPIDAISAYGHEFSRTKLIEKLTNLLNVDSVKPGKTHQAFCSLPFDIVCTTNFEFLLEDGYKLVNKYCRPIIEEDQLSISSTSDNLRLLKLHGDLHHPNRLIATEEDYDSFLSKYPMLSTFLANLLISRTPFFIGYSLDDNDFRQIWQLIKDRLGSLKRQGYVIKVNCSSHEKARFERRGVKVINIKGDPKDYSKILEKVFNELRDFWMKSYLKSNIISEDDAMAEFALPEETSNRLCFFSIPIKLLPFYKKYIFPVVESLGLIPISADDVISAGENWTAKIAALIDKSEFVIIDIATQNTYFELGIALTNKKGKLLIVKERDSYVPTDIKGYLYLERSKDPYDEGLEISGHISKWLKSNLIQLENRYKEEPLRLLEKREYRAAVIAAISLFENFLSTKIAENLDTRSSYRTLRSTLEFAIKLEIIKRENMKEIKEWMKIRNQTVHSNRKVTKSEAEKVVHGVLRLIRE